MTDPHEDSVREKIVTLKGLEPPSIGGLESTMPLTATPEVKLTMARYEQIMERLRQETIQTGPDLMVTVPDRDVSRLQSELARRSQGERQLDAGGLEVKFGTGFRGGDWLGWVER